MTGTPAPAELAALHGRCFVTPRPWSEAEFADFLTRPEVFLIGDGTGFALGRVVAGEAELLTIVVAPEQRRTGLGRHLMDRFVTEATRRNAVSAFLEVAEGNDAALGLYAACGFTRAGRRKGYYGTPDGQRQDALILLRPLALPSD